MYVHCQGFREDFRVSLFKPESHYHMHYFVTSERTYASSHFDNFKACAWISSYPQDFCESNPLISVRVSSARVIGDKKYESFGAPDMFYT